MESTRKSRKIATLRGKSGALMAPSGVFEASERGIGGVGAPPDLRWGVGGTSGGHYGELKYAKSRKWKLAELGKSQ